MLIHLACNAVLWLNALPAADGISSQHSPRYILLGRELTYDRHVRLEFGAYAQCHIAHSNAMEDRTHGAICLGPTGNAQGGHHFLNLVSGDRVTRYRWTPLPMPDEVVAHVSSLGRQQSMPPTLTFGDRHANLIPDTLDNIEDDHSEYSVSTSSSIPLSIDTSSVDLFSLPDPDVDTFSNPPEITGANNNDFANTTPTFANPQHDLHDFRQQNNHSEEQSTDEYTDSDTNEYSDNDTTQDKQEMDSQQGEPLNFVPDSPSPLKSPTMTSVQHTGADSSRSPQSTHSDPPKITGAGSPTSTDINDNAREQAAADAATDLSSCHESEDSVETPRTTLHDQFARAAEAGRLAAQSPRPVQLPPRTRKPKEYPGYSYFTDSKSLLKDLPQDIANTFVLLETHMMQDVHCYLTAQMTAKKGLEYFGSRGSDAIMKELVQLVHRKVLKAKKAHEITNQQKKAALKYLMFLKEKRDGVVKGRGCADGRKQRLYKTKE